MRGDRPRMLPSARPSATVTHGSAGMPTVLATHLRPTLVATLLLSCLGSRAERRVAFARRGAAGTSPSSLD